MELFKTIRNRRSIRRYKTDPVTDKDLSAVLDAARLAPSWSNTQCWRFIVVRDPVLKNELADTLTPPNRAADGMRQAPVVIVACAELGKSGFMNGAQGSDKGDWYMFDVALAMEHLVLAAFARGLGTVHIGWFDAPKAASILGVPKGYCVVEMTPLGYPAQDTLSPPRPRKPLSEIVFYEKFGNIDVGLP